MSGSLSNRKLSSVVVDAVEMSSGFSKPDAHVFINGYKFALLPGNRLDLKSMMGHDVLLLDSQGVVVPSEFGFVTLYPGQSYTTTATSALVPSPSKEAKEASAIPASMTISGPVTVAPHFLSPLEVANYLTKTGELRPTSPILKQIWGGIICGFFVAVGGLVAFAAAGGISPSTHAEHPIIARIMMGLTFPIALVLIICFGGELFTGNTCYMFMGWIHRKVTLWQLLRNWITSWSTNFIGCLFFGWLLAYETELYATDPFLSLVLSTTKKKVGMSWGVAFLRGIGANALVNAAVWLSTVGKDNVSRVVAMFIPIFTFVVIGFEHSVANMFFLPVGMMYGADFTVGDMLWKNLIPVTLGNIIGGAIVIGASAAFLHQFDPLFLEAGEQSIWYKIWTFGSDCEPVLKQKRSAFIKQHTTPAPTQVKVVSSPPASTVKASVPPSPTKQVTFQQPVQPIQQVIYRPTDGEVLRYTKRYIHKSGKVINVGVEASLVVEGGLPTRYIAFVIPLTQSPTPASTPSEPQKIVFRWGDREEHMEIGFSPSESQQPVPGAKRGLCVLRALDRVFIEVDDVYCELLGYSRQELIGQCVEFVTVPEDKSVTENVLRKKMRSMSTQPLLDDCERH